MVPALSARLREAPTNAGLTARQVAASTRLPVGTIDDLEHGRFERLPHGILGRGHVRAYASAVGLDGAAAVAEYVELRFGSAGEELAIQRPIPPDEGLGMAGTLLTIAAALGLVFALFHANGDRQPAAVPLGHGPAPAPAPAVALAAGSTSRRPPANPASLRIDVHPDGPCWISIEADEEVVVRRLLAGGEHARAVAENEIRLRVGDPGTFAFSINGSPGRPLGNPGRPLTISITRENYRALLEPAAPEADETAPLDDSGSESTGRR
jgi:hypothetical protein